VRVQPSSDDSLLVYLGDRIGPDANSAVIRLLRRLEQDPLEGIRNLHPAYCSLLIKFDALQWTHRELEAALRERDNDARDEPLMRSREIEIPVRYGGESGPDLGEVAALHDLTPAQVIDMHSSASYVVYFLGFVPGFAYLGGLPPGLETPRLDSPRRAVPAGSVGIAGSQTGVYPFSTPGGWRLIGRTQVAMFRPDREGMSLLAIGDRVRFTPAA
jgi:KipI family sensor histidine kinase inhibitor